MFPFPTPFLLCLLFSDDDNDVRADPARDFHREIKNTQDVKKNAFKLGKTRQNARIFEELLFFEATYHTKIDNKFTKLLPFGCLKASGRCIVPQRGFLPLCFHALPVALTVQRQ